jgi:glycerol transport system permease protein
MTIIKRIWLVLCFALLLVPIYWMVNTSLKSNFEILQKLTWIPQAPVLQNYIKILTQAVWRQAFINTITYVLLNVVLVLLASIPAAYAFSRFEFRGKKHLFFWLLTNRMAPGAAFLIPIFQLYANIGLFDTPLAIALAHCLFNLPLAIWILEGFMSGIPKEIDEIAFIDGYRFFTFFRKMFLPLISQGIAVVAFFCFLFSWTELVMAKGLSATRTRPVTVVLTRSLGVTGFDWGVIAAAGVVLMIPGLVLVFIMRNHITKGFSMGRV